MNKQNDPKKITIIGAGILGLTCANNLIKFFGQKNVQIFDSKGFPANNASHMAGGMLAPYCELDHMPQNFLPAGLFGIKYWETLALQQGNTFDFVQNGSLLLAHKHDQHLLDRFQSILPKNDTSWQKIGRNAIAEAESHLSESNFSSALLINAEAHLNPQKLMNTLCASIENKNTLHVSPEDFSATSDWVIDCRGIGAENDTPSLRGVKGEIIIVRNSQFKLSRPVRLMHPRYPLYIVPRADNIFMIGATIIESSDNNSVSIRSGLELASALYSLHQSFGDAEILSMHAGIRPAFPDNLPQIHLKNNIIRCNGLFRHGYLLSPAIADCVRALISQSHAANQESNFIPLFLKEKQNGHYSKRQTAHA